MSAPLLAIERLAITFPAEAGRTPVVDRVALSISPGETLALVGESGCGKSITALAIMRLVPRPGRIEPGSCITFEGRDVAVLPVPEMRNVRGSRIGMIFQEPMTSLNPVITVGEQVMEAVLLHARVSREVARRRVLDMFATVGIPAPDRRFSAYPHELSGGLKQRVMIAMAMVMRPLLLIADEPTTALDATIRAQILDLIRNLAATNGTAVLLITHDFGVVNEVSDRVAVMYAGQIVEEGTRVELLAQPAPPLHARPAQIHSAARGARHAPQRDQGSGAAPRAMACGLPLPHPLSASSSTVAAARPPRAPRSRKPRAPGATWWSRSRGRERAVRRCVARTARACAPGFPSAPACCRRVTGHVKAVDGVDLTIFPGETLALVGESGCGKTTVGRSILRLVEPTEGSIWFDGVESLSGSRKADFHPYRRRMQIVMQDPASALDPRFTVRDAIAEGMESFEVGSSRQERTERVAELMGKVSLDPATMWRYPHEFSGGQRQRICIARALAVDPALLICDEATSALDVSIQAQILNLLADLQAERNLAYLFITHDLGVVRYFATRIAVMYLGRIVEVGTDGAGLHRTAAPLHQGAAGLDPLARSGNRRGIKPAALGDVPSPDNPPSGLPLSSALHVRLPTCSLEDPPVVEFADGMSRCVLARQEQRAEA